MSDAQRDRTQAEQAARDAGSVEVGYAPSATGASLGPNEPPREAAGTEGPTGHRDSVGDDDLRDGGKDESERVPVMSGRSEESPIEIRALGRTDVGLVREHNEDNYLLVDLANGSRDPQSFRYVPPEGLLLAVCDGMGGAAAGEVASQMAVDTLYEMMRKSVPSADRDAFARSLVHSIEEAGTRIFESARADRSRRGMGTTATVAALMDKILFVGQVGDSRAYVLRAGELKQITKDQSLVNQLIEAGQLTEDEAEAFEHSNIILQALGTTEQVIVDLTFLELRRGDRLLLCSDGLSGLLHGDVLREVMKEHRDLAACCERLIELAKAAGGHDNVTVILADFSSDALALPEPHDLFGYQQYPLPLDQERRLISQVHSELPTLAPPSIRPPPADELEEPRDGRAGQPGSSSAGRLFLFAMLIVGAAGAIYYWMAARQRRSPNVGGEALTPVIGEQAPAPRVEVLVRTDVEGAELLVDGESYSSTESGQWVLELPPGPHRLEARAGGSVITSSLVTVREGVPATVVLSMPEGAELAWGDAGAEESGDAGAEESGEESADESAELPKSARHRREGAGALVAEEASARRRARRLREKALAAESGTTPAQERHPGERSAATDAGLAAQSEARRASERTPPPPPPVKEPSVTSQAPAAQQVPRAAGVKDAGVKP